MFQSAKVCARSDFTISQEGKVPAAPQMTFQRASLCIPSPLYSWLLKTLCFKEALLCLSEYVWSREMWPNLGGLVGEEG